MKSSFAVLFFFTVQFMCYGQETSQKSDNPPLNQDSFGEGITSDGALSEAAMYARYGTLSVADSIPAKFSGTVIDVCRVKGCWMKLELTDGKETMVRFKDYGFFVPRDITGKKVTVQGTAFVEEMSVERQRHYALDEGASEEEVAKIKAPLKTYGFEAVGVLLED
ncbi:MAG: DUF4920 domain-containing protein [Bacteroidota bacterium]